MAGCLTTAGVLCVGFGAFISGNKVLAQNMMCAPDVENKLAQPSASWRSGGSSQRQITRQATPGSGQPRPIGRLGRLGTPAISGMVSTTWRQAGKGRVLALT